MDDHRVSPACAVLMARRDPLPKGSPRVPCGRATPSGGRMLAVGGALPGNLRRSNARSSGPAETPSPSPLSGSAPISTHSSKLAPNDRTSGPAAPSVRFVCCMLVSLPRPGQRARAQMHPRPEGPLAYSAARDPAHGAACGARACRRRTRRRWAGRAAGPRPAAIDQGANRRAMTTRRGGAFAAPRRPTQGPPHPKTRPPCELLACSNRLAGLRAQGRRRSRDGHANRTGRAAARSGRGSAPPRKLRAAPLRLASGRAARAQAAACRVRRVRAPCWPRRQERRARLWRPLRFPALSPSRSPRRHPRRLVAGRPPLLAGPRSMPTS